MIRKAIPYGLVCSFVITKLVPHPPNFTATNSAVVYGNTVLKPIWNILIPLVLIVLSDIVNNILINDWGISAFTFYYGVPAYFISSVLTRLITHNDKKLNKIHNGLTVLMSSVIFFIYSNLMVFFQFCFSVENVGECFIQTYVDAIPFFGWEVFGNVIFSIVYFTIHYFLVELQEINDDELLISQVNDFDQKLTQDQERCGDKENKIDN